MTPEQREELIRLLQQGGGHLARMGAHPVSAGEARV